MKPGEGDPASIRKEKVKCAGIALATFLLLTGCAGYDYGIGVKYKGVNARFTWHVPDKLASDSKEVKLPKLEK